MTTDTDTPDGAPPPADEFTELEGQAPLEGETIPGRRDAGDDAELLELTEACRNLAVAGFTVLAPAWGVTDEEIEQLAVAGALVAKKYGASIKEWPELNLVMVAAAIYLPRRGLPRRHEPPPPAGDDASSSSSSPADTPVGARPAGD